MDTLISDLAKAYIEKLRCQDDRNLQFVEFKMDANQESTIGMHSDGIGGEIVYKTDDKLCKSEPIFVKFFSTEDPTHKFRPSVPALFDKEIHFYTRVFPFLNSLRNIEHLIPSFLHFKKETRQGDTVAIMFRHFGPQWVCNNYSSFLDYPHLSLMMRKLGEFHAYSFAAKCKDQSEFLRLSSFRTNGPPSIELFQAQMKRTLERSLQPLRQDRRYVEAIPRLEKSFGNFTDFVCQSYGSSPEDPHYVLGHSSFSQANVLFSYANRVPVDMKVADWQSSWFLPLGVDLIVPLYADASPQTRDEYWDRLLDDYHHSLRTTFDHNIVPSKDQILAELKKAVGFATFLVTYRANNLHVKSNSQEKPSATLWNDEFVSQMLKDMINRGFL